jgi:hypothetical protein
MTHLVAAAANWVRDDNVAYWARGGAEVLPEHTLGEAIPTVGTMTGERERDRVSER